ncbi:DUF4365 domain-containing protein [Clostridium botulinum]|uniref:DUF4365 domain-containing protein n=1 Tax=Clostridium botulinum TaxID=1491 RepID=UPI0001F84CAA|nr:DUF4365 domain-containing protein [Clostridium botulinum]KEI92672.1 hypothetical protein N491_12775 [Clostridium botulinum B2 275]NFB16262.1 DUF4365 domain-containing protein [Clostridium botulinum]NFB67148.1 DUF4365 domain-containing protein [Clostridium botulinum]NFB96737.1 DUF4365 domain-containing protein [Clostridium botulinum]NFC28790.1 DUF4365 domain-containing protein [Clostridium botulinum]
MNNIKGEDVAVENYITEEHIKEGISKAYVKALAHFAGLNVQEYEYDYGIDGTFSGVKIRGNRRVENGHKLDFQLKASINVNVDEEIIKYDLETKNYNDLVDTEVGTPRILILYKLPKNKQEWLNISEKETIFKECAWWSYLYGKEPTKNKTKKTITIPRKQLLNVESLKQLMSKVERGELV